MPLGAPVLKGEYAPRDKENRLELPEIPTYHRYLSYLDEMAALCKALHALFTFKLYASLTPGDFPFSPMK